VWVTGLGTNGIPLRVRFYGTTQRKFPLARMIRGCLRCRINSAGSPAMGLPADGPVAQLDRASDFGSEGWGFDSLRGRHILKTHDLTVFYSLRTSFVLHSLPCSRLTVATVHPANTVPGGTKGAFAPFGCKDSWTGSPFVTRLI
jgi:hypothetical protein